MTADRRQAPEPDQDQPSRNSSRGKTGRGLNDAGYHARTIILHRPSTQHEDQFEQAVIDQSTPNVDLEKSRERSERLHSSRMGEAAKAGASTGAPGLKGPEARSAAPNARSVVQARQPTTSQISKWWR